MNGLAPGFDDHRQTRVPVSKTVTPGLLGCRLHQKIPGGSHRQREKCAELTEKHPDAKGGHS